MVKGHLTGCGQHGHSFSHSNTVVREKKLFVFKVVLFCLFILLLLFSEYYSSAMGDYTKTEFSTKSNSELLDLVDFCPLHKN